MNAAEKAILAALQHAPIGPSVEHAARRIAASLDELGFVIRKKPATRRPAAPVEAFAPNTGDADLDAFMRRKHNPKRRALPLPRMQGLPALRPMKVTEQDAAESAYRAEAAIARTDIASGKKPNAEVVMRELIALHRNPWVKHDERVEGVKHDERVEVVEYRSVRHSDIRIEHRKPYRDAPVFWVLDDRGFRMDNGQVYRIADAEKIADEHVAKTA